MFEYSYSKYQHTLERHQQMLEWCEAFNREAVRHDVTVSEDRARQVTAHHKAWVKALRSDFFVVLFNADGTEDHNNAPVDSWNSSNPQRGSFAFVRAGGIANRTGKTARLYWKDPEHGYILYGTINPEVSNR